MKTLFWNNRFWNLSRFKSVEIMGFMINIECETFRVVLDICEHPRVREIISELGEDCKKDAIAAAFKLIVEFLAHPSQTYLNLTNSLFTMTDKKSEPKEKVVELVKPAAIVNLTDVTDVVPS